MLGNEVVQAGSWVGTDRMRFDFRSPGGALTPEQQRAVDTARQRDDPRRRPSRHRELPLEDAHQTGAIAMAGEHYGELVRVVRAGPSVEFCGGTHAHSTGELGLFVMLSESSIGSGIRRIEAAVSKAAETYVERQQSLVGALSETLAAKPEDLLERVGKLQTDVRDLQRAIGEIKARLAANDAQTYVERAESINGKALVAAVVPEANAEALKHLSNAIRARLRSGSSRSSASTTAKCRCSSRHPTTSSRAACTPGTCCARRRRSSRAKAAEHPRRRRVAARTRPGPARRWPRSAKRCAA